ncbi:hypothetical protein IEO21_00376 [Rhodonia placenta]|uniref:RNA-dependent RNA polymerase n=1 Tax=Rhodonia placenta TaxID=104341 RepID=A0A8H7PC92_9APHY|nr:hypothetical protein IEO21_00376 [Postia placenta]
MEILMRNIAPSANPPQLKISLANILHSPDYPRYRGRVANFEVYIFRSREEIGQHFLREYGGQTPSKSLVIGIRIHFTQSNRPMREDTLEVIRRLPFVDPREQVEREERDNQLEQLTVSVSTIQFGWVCRDDIFSVEYEKRCSRGSVEFRQDRREWRIKVYEADIVRIVAIRAAQVYWMAASVDHLDGPIIFFYLNYPPSFETESMHHDLSTLFAGLMLHGNNAEPTRQRWSAFDDEHACIAPSTSLAIRVVCQSTNDLENMRRCCRIANSRVDESSYPIAYRSLFSPERRLEYQAWVSGLDWNVAFQVEALARSQFIDLRQTMGLRPEIEQMVAEHGPKVTSAFLRNFLGQAKSIFWYGTEFTPPTTDDNFDCLRVIVTPTCLHLEGPDPERSNRVFRRYPGQEQNFLRVTFVDETRLMYRFDREVDGRGFINRRVRHMLVQGLTIAGRHFEFLAYSQSALKEHAVWFVTPFRDPDGREVRASTIIASLGSFRPAFEPQLIYCPARYAARISQAFTATDSSISVELEEVFYDLDIKDNTGQYCFTDGVGRISSALARAISSELRAKKRRARRARTYTRLFQIRFMGSKGMLSVDYQLSDRSIFLRPSMIKFDAPDSLNVEIARAFDKPGKYYLNRPLIMLLEGLGVPYEVFEALQDDAVQDAEGAVHSLESSARLLEAYGLGASFRLPSTMVNMHRLGLRPLSEDIFWQQMMDFAVNHVLRELKHHARIPLPDGWTLVGVADVHGYLEEGEIFACVDSPDLLEPIYLEGPTVISRSPTIHPGDVQLVHAIGRPPPGSPFEHESLRNGVVFSIKGERPLPSCLGGGDLDGDVYNVTTMPSLRPARTYQSGSYEPAVKKTVDHPSTMEDVADFVAEYISSDTLGIIAINWLIIADQSSEGILDPHCLRLAQLHSDAVDYPKSGNPVPLERIPRLKFKAKPDWNAPETLTRATPDFYESTRAIGRLYRRIELPALRTVTRASRFQRRNLEDGHELTLADILDGFQEDNVDEDVISRLWELFEYYSSRLRTICADHTLSDSRSAMLTEEEAVIGTIVAKCSQPRKRKDLMSQLREQTATLVASVRDEIAGEIDTPSEKSLERAWIAYNIALMEDDYFGARSFAWIALGEIFDAIKDIEEEDRRLLR